MTWMELVELLLPFRAPGTMLQVRAGNLVDGAGDGFEDGGEAVAQAGKANLVAAQLAEAGLFR